MTATPGALPPRWVYAAVALALLAVEVAIARWGSGWVRGSLGDVLVIVLLYAIARALWRANPAATALACTVVGLVVEGLQALHVADRLGLPRGSALSIIIGNTASVEDLAMYAIGGVLAWAVDTGWLRQRTL